MAHAGDINDGSVQDGRVWVQWAGENRAVPHLNTRSCINNSLLRENI
jgi:hypothetical protein